MVWWFMPVVTAVGRLRQEDNHELRTAWSAALSPYSREHESHGLSNTNVILKLAIQ